MTLALVGGGLGLGLASLMPVALKDNMCTQGVPTTCGSKILEHWQPPYDATVVTRIRDAGGIVMIGVVLQGVIAWFWLPNVDPGVGLPIAEPDLGRSSHADHAHAEEHEKQRKQARIDRRHRNRHANSPHAPVAPAIEIGSLHRIRGSDRPGSDRFGPAGSATRDLSKDQLAR